MHRHIFHTHKYGQAIALFSPPRLFRPPQRIFTGELAANQSFLVVADSACRHQKHLVDDAAAPGTGRVDDHETVFALERDRRMMGLGCGVVVYAALRWL